MYSLAGYQNLARREPTGFQIRIGVFDWLALTIYKFVYKIYFHYNFTIIIFNFIIYLHKYGEFVSLNIEWEIRWIR